MRALWLLILPSIDFARYRLVSSTAGRWRQTEGPGKIRGNES